MKLSQLKRMAWRDLKGNCAPTGWMSDEQLEAITPKMVSLRAIKQSVALANSAPLLLEACKALLERYTSLVNCGDCGNWNPEEESEVKAARTAIEKATP